jgi:hypothetical protein
MKKYIKFFEQQNQLVGGLGDKANKENFDKDQIEKGLAVEMEHTNNKEIALEIVLDHLTEHPKYYDYLEDMEHQFEEKAVSNYKPFLGRRTFRKKNE